MRICNRKDSYLFILCLKSAERMNRVDIEQIKISERMTPKAKFAKVPHASQFKAHLKPEPKISTKSSSGNYQVENPNDCPLPPPPGFKDKTGRYEEEPVDDFANAGGAFSSCRPSKLSSFF